ncbi:MAG: hypothetical protein Fur0021_24570 [Candidatus Promineifilaceae bacterium]
MGVSLAAGGADTHLKRYPLTIGLDSLANEWAGFVRQSWEVQRLVGGAFLSAVQLISGAVTPAIKGDFRSAI